MKYITIIGSRSAPESMKDSIREILVTLIAKEWIVRSGGADGADTFGEQIADELGFAKEIYLPWKKFNKNPSPLYNITPESISLAATIHPAWDACNDAARRLHGRNCYQVLGYDLKTPSHLLICWTLDGQEKGGTRTAIVLAKRYGVPVFNLAVCDSKEIIEWLYLDRALDELTQLGQDMGDYD